MEWITIIGLLAATGTTAAFIPQVAHTMKTKDTSGISLPMYIMFTTGVFLWLVYGIINVDLPIIIANIITFSLALIELTMKLKYG